MRTNEHADQHDSLTGSFAADVALLAGAWTSVALFGAAVMHLIHRARRG